MAQVIPNAITPVQIQELRDYYDTKQVDAHTPNFSNNKNLEYHIEDDISYRIFNPVFTSLLGEHEFDTGAYKESLQPYGIHTDSRVKHKQIGVMLFGDTVKHNLLILCPLDSGKENKTLVFKHTSDFNPHESDETTTTINNNGLLFEDYSHCDELVTQLEIDIEYSWNAGDLLVCNRDQWHCSNYFKVNNDTKNFLIFFIA